MYLCLRPPDADADDWFAYIPTSFNSALDIRPTKYRGEVAWTQGGRFSFKRGDVIYDKKECYFSWDDARTHMGICIQITAAAPVSWQVDSSRDPGRVDFTVYRPNKDRSNIEPESFESITHDEFVHFLISGSKKMLPEIADKYALCNIIDTEIDISLSGKHVCFTGKFSSHTRRELKEIVLQSGGIFHKDISWGIDYLVVGTGGNSQWAYGSFGEKIRLAIEYQKKGSRLKIITEEDFLHALARLNQHANPATL